MAVPVRGNLARTHPNKIQIFIKNAEVNAPYFVNNALYKGFWLPTITEYKYIYI